MRVPLIIIFSFVSLLSSAQTYTSAGTGISSGNPVQDKNFYFFTLLQAIPEAYQIISEDAYLAGLTQSKRAALQTAKEKCQGQGDCLSKYFSWSDQDIDSVSDHLRSLYQSEAVFRDLVAHHLRASRCYQNFMEFNDEDLIAKSWELSARGLNHIIATYAMGEDGLYPAIDSVSFKVNGVFYENLLQSAMHYMAEDENREGLFFQTSLDFVLMLLELNNRDEASRFEPLPSGENSKALASIALIDWQKYPYSVILVPGHGPDQAEIALSPLAKLRNNLAAKRYREGQAPLIIVSGGNVHPFQTPYNEAYEMKEDLMNRLQIPEQAILIEPHARHTTTNFRNAARIIFRYGIPSEKPALVTTTYRQSYYITDMGLEARCQKELGYVPFRIMERLNEHDVVWIPSINALHLNPLDPLDP